MDSSALRTVKALWRAFERHGYAGALDFMGPDTEWAAREGRVFRGRSEMEEFVEEIRRREISIEPRCYGFEEFGRYVLVSGGLRTRTPRGLSDVLRHWLYEVRDGRITHVDDVSSRAEALSLMRGAAAA